MVDLEHLTYAILSVQMASRSAKSICQIAVSGVKDGKSEGTIVSYIKPPTKSFTFTEYHGITWDKVKNSPTLGEMWDKIAPLLEGKKVFVYDTERTQKWLEKSLENYKLPAPNCEYIDICSLFSNLSKRALANMAKIIGYDDEFMNGNSRENLALYEAIIEKRIDDNSRLLKKIFK